MSTFWYYMDYYRDFLLQQWNDMGPMGYGTMLIAIGIGGYLMMGRGFKRM